MVTRRTGGAEAAVPVDRGGSNGPVVVGPVPAASPARSLQAFRARVESAKRDGIPVPDGFPRHDLQVFRDQLQAAKTAGVQAFMAPIATVERGVALFQNLLRVQEFCAAASGDVVLVSTVEALTEARRLGRVAVIGQLQGMHALAEDLSLIGGLRAAGVGVMGLTHAWKTPFGDGAYERSDQGLTARGRMAVEAVNQSNVVLDLSLVGRRTSLDAMAVTNRPVVFSHSNVDAVHPHPTNLTAEQLASCAATGSVIGVSACPHLVAPSARIKREEVLLHVDYIAQKIGVAHVALGLDFGEQPRQRFSTDPVPDGPIAFPDGLSGFEDLAGISHALESRGYSTNEARDIMGGNFLRVLTQGWSSAT